MQLELLYFLHDKEWDSVLPTAMQYSFLILHIAGRFASGWHDPCCQYGLSVGLDLRRGKDGWKLRIVFPPLPFLLIKKMKIVKRDMINDRSLENIF